MKLSKIQRLVLHHTRCNTFFYMWTMVHIYHSHAGINNCSLSCFMWRANWETQNPQHHKTENRSCRKICSRTLVTTTSKRTEMYAVSQRGIPSHWLSLPCNLSNIQQAVCQNILTQPILSYLLSPCQISQHFQETTKQMVTVLTQIQPCTKTSQIFFGHGHKDSLSGYLHIPLCFYKPSQAASFCWRRGPRCILGMPWIVAVFYQNSTVGNFHLLVLCGTFKVCLMISTWCLF